MQRLGMNKAGLSLAADLLRSGGLVSIPTETVYGLAGDATNMKSIQEIYDVKQRPYHNPLIVHVDTIDRVAEFAEILPKFCRIC